VRSPAQYSVGWSIEGPENAVLGWGRNTLQNRLWDRVVVEVLGSSGLASHPRGSHFRNRVGQGSPRTLRVAGNLLVAVAADVLVVGFSHAGGILLRQ